MTSSFTCREFHRRVATPCSLGMARFGCGTGGCRKPATAILRKKPGGGGLGPGPRPRVTDAITREERDHRSALTQTALPTNREQPPPHLREPGADACAGEAWTGDVNLLPEAGRLDRIEILRRFRAANREQAESPEEAQDMGEDGTFPFLRVTADVDAEESRALNIPHDLAQGTGGGEEAGEPKVVVNTLQEDGFRGALHHGPGGLPSLPPAGPDSSAAPDFGSELPLLPRDLSEELVDLGSLGMTDGGIDVPRDLSRGAWPPAFDSEVFGPALDPSGTLPEAAPARDPLAHLMAETGPVCPPALDPLGPIDPLDPSAGLPDPFVGPLAEPPDPLDPFPPDPFGGLP